MILEFFIFLYNLIKEKIKNPSSNNKSRLREVVKKMSFKTNKETLDSERKEHEHEEDFALIGLIVQELQIHIEKEYLPLFATIVNTIDRNQDILLYRYTISENTTLPLCIVTKEALDYSKTQDFLQKITRILTYQVTYLLDKKVQPIIKQYSFHVETFKQFHYLSVIVHFYPLKEVKIRRFKQEGR